MKIQFKIRPALKTLALIIGKALVTFLSAFIYAPRHSVCSPISGILQGMPPQWKNLKGDKSLVGPCPTGPQQAENISRSVLFCKKQHIAQSANTGLDQAKCDSDSMDVFSKHILGFGLQHASHHLDRAAVRPPTQTCMVLGAHILQT